MQGMLIKIIAIMKIVKNHDYSINRLIPQT